MRGPSTIVVDNGRIVSVTDGLARIEPGVAYIDLSAKTVLPGLIDSHVHLDSDRGGEQELLSDVRDDAPLQAFEAQMNGMKVLRAGFTTVRNLGDDSGITRGLRDAVNRGWVQGPRIVDAGEAISTSGGHMDGRGALNDDFAARLPEPENLCDSVESGRRVGPPPDRPGRRRINFAPTGGVKAARLSTRMVPTKPKRWSKPRTHVPIAFTRTAPTGSRWRSGRARIRSSMAR